MFLLFPNFVLKKFDESEDQRRRAKNRESSLRFPSWKGCGRVCLMPETRYRRSFVKRSVFSA